MRIFQSGGSETLENVNLSIFCEIELKKTLLEKSSGKNAFWQGVFWYKKLFLKFLELAWEIKNMGIKSPNLHEYYAKRIREIRDKTKNFSF